MENEEGKKFIFDGFAVPQTTQVPDQVFDYLLPRLSGAEIKVLLYIIRRTFGFKKSSDDVSFSQICTGITTRDGRILDEGTGLSKSTAQVAIKGLLEKRVVYAIKRQSAERGNEPTTYALKFRTEMNHPYTENRHRGIPKIGTALYRKSATQHTVRQQTDIQTNVNVGFIKNENDLIENERATILVGDLMEQLNDRNPRSKATFRKIVTALGTDKVYRLLGNAKEAYRGGLVSSPKLAGYFIGMAKNVAKENGIDLGFKTENGQPTRNGQQPVHGLVADLANLKSGFRNRARNVTAREFFHE